MDLKNQTIVILANARFDSEIMATSLFLARQLARHNKVYFIDHPFTIKDYLHQRKIDRSRRGKLRPLSDGIINTDIANLKVVIMPPVFPINFLPEGDFFRTLLKLNERILLWRIKRFIKKDKIKDFIYINSFEFHYPNLAKALKPRLNVYHCVDPIIVGYDIKHGVPSEYKLVKESDLVICTSKALYQEKKQINPETYFVPNAGEIRHFSTALDERLPVHEKIKDLPKPVVGYLGTIERRIDYELMEEVVKQNPDKSFVFAGPVWDAYLSDPLREYTNVHMLGHIPYSEAPMMVKGFDVAIIPFKTDEVSNTIFPLKLFEYLSAGKPVVITEFNQDLKDFTEDAVTYCGDAASFSQGIELALAENTPDKVGERLELAGKNSWANRAERFASILAAKLTPVPPSVRPSAVKIDLAMPPAEEQTV